MKSTNNNGNIALCPFQKAQLKPIDYICSIVCKKKPVRNSQSGESYVCQPVKFKRPVRIEQLELHPEPYLKSCVDGIYRIENLKNRIRITWAAITTMVFALVASFFIFALSGFGLMTLPDKMVYCLGVFTLGSIMTTMGIVLKHQVRPEPDKSRKNN